MNTLPRGASAPSLPAAAIHTAAVTAPPSETSSVLNELPTRMPSFGVPLPSSIFCASSVPPAVTTTRLEGAQGRPPT